MARGWYDGIVAQKQAAGYGEPRIADLVGVTDKTGETIPIRQVDLGFGAINDGLLEGDGKADGCVVDLIVVCVVVYEPAKVVGVQSELFETGFGQTLFVIVSFRRLDG